MELGKGANVRRLKHNIKAVIFISMSVVLAGCVYDPVYYGPPAYPAYHPHYYDYYYYPYVGVYFHFTTGYYYYHDRGRWVRAKRLPAHIHLDVRDRVKLRVDSEKPYLNYPEHKRIYKPKPDYRVDKERSMKEREANRNWYREYEQKREKYEKQEKGWDKETERDKGKKRHDR